jgi:antitoxin component YwqK of YwqJK toxin-antitoxin module
MKAESYLACKEKVDEIVKTLEKTCKLIRVKIECPFYKHYQKNSLYMESHFVTASRYFPVSRNQNKKVCLSTERTYNKDEYESFAKRYQKEQIELCLYDTNVKEDSDWFGWYEENNFATDMAFANFRETENN